MGGLSIWHWVIVLVVVVIVFGTGKLRNAGSDLGKAVKGFKDGVKGDEDKHPVAGQQPPVPPVSPQMVDKGTIDVETREKSRF